MKRAMNRPPQEADCRGRQGRGADCADPHCRYHMHRKTCGGAYVKVCTSYCKNGAAFLVWDVQLVMRQFEK